MQWVHERQDPGEKKGNNYPSNSETEEKDWENPSGEGGV